MNIKAYKDPNLVKIYIETLKGCEDHPLYEQWIHDGEKGVDYILNSECIEKMAGFLNCALQEALILDMGCGTGNGIVAFHSLGADHCVGVDISMEGLGLRLAQSRLRRNSIPDRLVAASGLRLPFKDGTFDLILSHNVAEHVKDMFSYFCEMHRVLKPSGIGLIGTANRVWPRDSHFALLFAPWLPNRLLKFYAVVRGRHRKGDLWDTFWRTPWTIIRVLQRIGFEIVATTAYYMKPKEESKNKFRRKIIDKLLGIGIKIDYFSPTIRLCVRKGVVR